MGLRAGIAGYGLAGSVFHAPLIEAVDGLEVAAVMTRSPERAALARTAHAGVRVVESVQDLLEDIDLLVVATPNSSHGELAELGIERGLHVVVDKPLAVSADQGRQIAEAAGGRVTVFQNRRWDGDFLTIKRLLREGALGRVTRFESRFERFRPEIKQGWREGGDPALGGGVLLDLGPHVVDQAVHLFGPPESVYGEVRTLRENALVDDDAFIALRHRGGEISHLWMSAIAPLHGPRFRVSGMKAGFACDGLDPQEAQLRDGMRPHDPGFGRDGSGWLGADAAEAAEGTDAAPVADPPAPADAAPAADAARPADAAHAAEEVPAADAAPAADAPQSGRRIELERGNYVAFYEGVRAWIQDGAPPPVDPRDAVRVLEILEEARG